MKQEEYKFYQNFDSRDDLKQFESNALLLYSLQLRYGIEDIMEVAATALVDGSDDKKTDIVFIDTERREAVIGQGYVATTDKDSAPSNKASDLNTSVTWLLTRNINEIPERIQAAALELRNRIKDNEIDRITLWYSHNLPESTNVDEELKSAENTLNSILSTNFPSQNVESLSLEVGLETLENWYEGLTTPILVTDVLTIENVSGFKLEEDKWTSFSTVMPATKLHELYEEYGTDLFSANVRDYLGSRKSDSNINNGIKLSAEKTPENFYVYNNGVTALVNDFTFEENTLTIKGISIVNGAQTTGAIGSLSNELDDKVKVPLRLIKCQDENIIASIVKYNNSQNKVNAPDFRSNDQIQKRLVREFDNLRHVNYSSRRGGSVDIIKRNPSVIPSVTAGQVLAAFHRQPSIAYNQKSKIWESDNFYPRFFNENTTAKHIFLVYSLQRAIEELKFGLMKSSTMTENQEGLLKFLRSRGSIVLFTTAVSTCIEEILGKPVSNLFKLKFCDDMSIEDGIENWNPIITILSSFSETLNTGLSDGIKNEEKINNALSQFKQLVSAVKTANSIAFEEFAEKICE
ncbi:AIPR family protein [Maribacter sp. MAR_2009_72]|uniref:AIPR family protein n=1 Tax=Maribacter sp. MAR_2009_72 TaxID=1250050 RepID=UPI001199C733|nr:AIPR family protein [Maribacter sp. MAR_2009_72]TVZ15481.1 AIPR protein [Maribacter sp. MAR_2009_72]